MTTRHRLTLRAAALVVLPVLALSLASCSAAGAGASGQSSSPSAANDADSWQLQFAQCMRDRGIDYADPEADGPVSAENDEASLAASEECTNKLGPAPAPEGGSPSDTDTQQLFLDAARCLTEKGFVTPDPKEGQGLAIPEGVSPEALEACGLPGQATGGIGGRR